MNTKLAIALGILATPLIYLTTAAPAEAAPPCVAFNTCQYMPNPVDGPLMPTWDTPGYYGGWNNGITVCDPFTYACRGVNPQP